MTLLQTRDQSYTLKSDKYGEAYHSMGGAYTEAESLYFKGCELDAKAKNAEVSILDIGFGLGYNVFVSILNIHRINPNCRIEIISYENSEEPLDFEVYPNKIKDLAFKIKSHWQRTKDRIFYADDRVTLTIWRMDARQGVSELGRKFDAIFLDPFSPKTDPTLWTVDFFKVLAFRLKPDGRIATYSIATPVVVGFLEAGLQPRFIEGTVTKKNALIVSHDIVALLSYKYRAKLKRSPERIPFRDASLTKNRDEIRHDREREKEGL